MGLLDGITDFLGLDAILDPGKDERRRALRNQENALDMWLDLGDEAPSASDISTENRQPNAWSDYQRSALNVAGDDAQLQALRQMQDISNAGGYTSLEQGQIRQAQQQAAQYERSQRLAALQQMQARGMAGGGGELAARLQAQQSGANRAANDATNIATAAQQRALQAMQSGANIGANISNQEQQFGMKKADAINAFNQTNAASRGQANQQAFQNRMNILAGGTGQYNANANSLYDQANQQAQAARDMISTVAGALS